MPRSRIVFDPTTTPIMTRQQAINAKLKRYWSGQPCTHGHIALRYTSTNGCQHCLSPPPQNNLRGDGGVNFTINLAMPEGIDYSPEDWQSIDGLARRTIGHWVELRKLELSQALLLPKAQRIEMRLDEPVDDPDHIPEGDERAALQAEAFDLRARLSAMRSRIVKLREIFSTLANWR